MGLNKLIGRLTSGRLRTYLVPGVFFGIFKFAERFAGEKKVTNKNKMCLLIIHVGAC